ncbi:hypothetical protein D3C80_1478200 [compost metagenome]
MAAHPLPGHLVAVDLLIELLPQVSVLHRLLGGGLPAALLPVDHPFVDALHHVLRVGGQHHLAFTLERHQALDRGHQLHAVVGGLTFAAPQFLLDALVDHQHAPATRARVALAGTISKHLDAIAHVPLLNSVLVSFGVGCGAVDFRQWQRQQLAHWLAAFRPQRPQAYHHLARHQQVHPATGALPAAGQSFPALQALLPGR